MKTIISKVEPKELQAGIIITHYGYVVRYFLSVEIICRLCGHAVPQSRCFYYKLKHAVPMRCPRVSSSRDSEARIKERGTNLACLRQRRALPLHLYSFPLEVLWLHLSFKKGGNASPHNRPISSPNIYAYR